MDKDTKGGEDKEPKMTTQIALFRAARTGKNGSELVFIPRALSSSPVA